MKITALRSAVLALTVLALLAGTDNSWGQTKSKAGSLQQGTSANPAPKGGSDPGSWGQWIADVERPAAGKNKTPTITAKCHQPGSSRSVTC
jgi:hypothetical protein